MWQRAVLAMLLVIGLVENRSLQKRSILEFGEMIYDVVRKNPFDFTGYGRWCGFGGEGEPLDKIDECCKYHDLCYANVEDTTNCTKLAGDSSTIDAGETVVLLTYYNYEVEGGVVICDPSNSRCGQMMCACDKKITECIAANIQDYTPDNYQFRLF